MLVTNSNDVSSKRSIRSSMVWLSSSRSLERGTRYLWCVQSDDEKHRKDNDTASTIDDGNKEETIHERNESWHARTLGMVSI